MMIDGQHDSEELCPPSERLSNSSSGGKLESSEHGAHMVQRLVNLHKTRDSAHNFVPPCFEPRKLLGNSPGSGKSNARCLGALKACILLRSRNPESHPHALGVGIQKA